MTDVFREVDEEVRREQLKKLWERYGNYAVAAAVVVVAAVAAWRGYGWWEAKKAAQAGADFEIASNLADSGKHAEAEAAFTKVAKEGTASYRALARVRAAAELAQTDQKAAIGAYEAIAAEGTGVLQDLASLRVAALLLDAGSLTEAQQRLEPLAGNDRTFRHTARELLVLAAWKAGNEAQAKHWSELIQGDAQTPPATRSRVEVLMELVASGSKGS